MVYNLRYRKVEFGLLSQISNRQDHQTGWKAVSIHGRKREIDWKVPAVPGRFWDAKFELWPVPQQEIFLNPALEQNPGYNN